VFLLGEDKGREVRVALQLSVNMLSHLVVAYLLPL